jgi:hypothetical protein
MVSAKIDYERRSDVWLADGREAEPRRYRATATPGT